MKDCVGEDIHVGDVITYPGRGSGACYVNTGIVEEITDAETLKVKRVGRDFKRINDDDYGWVTTTRLVTVYATERVTVTSRTQKELYAYYEGRKEFR